MYNAAFVPRLAGRWLVLDFATEVEAVWFAEVLGKFVRSTSFWMERVG